MTVQKRKQEEPDFEGFIEGNEIPPHLVESLKGMSSGNGGQWPASGTTVVDPEPEPALDPLAEYRIDILGKAAHIVTADRNVQYGPPEQSFDRIAAMWAAYLGLDTLLAVDVAAMLVLLKVARIATNPLHEDNWVDVAGYGACGASAAKALESELPEEG